MNKKGQLGIGLIIVVAIAIIIGLIMFQAIASNVETGTQAVKGATVTTNYNTVGILNTNVELPGQELVSVQAVTNRTDGVAIAAANYTIAECVRASDNLKGICYTRLGDGAESPLDAVNITYTYYPAGYIDDAGGRAIAGIIVLLAAIAIAFVVFGGIKYDF